MLALVTPTHDEDWAPDFAAFHDEWRLSSLVDSIDNGDEVAALIEDLGLTFSLQAVEDFRVEFNTARSEALEKKYDLEACHRFESSLVSGSLFPRLPYVSPDILDWVWFSRSYYMYVVLCPLLTSC